MANRYELQSGTGIIELESSTDDLLLESDGPIGETAVDRPRMPVVRHIAVQAQSWMVNRFLGVAEGLSSIFRQPLIVSRRQVCPTQQLSLATNLLLTTLAVVAPFTPANATQLDPVRVHTQAQQPTVSGNLLESTLAEVYTPFTQTNWTNPRRVVPRALVPFSHRYAGEPVVADATKPFLQSNWQNPELRSQYVHSFTGGRVLGEEPYPFTQTEWPNPVLKLNQTQELVAPQILSIVGVAQVTPFFQIDWPNPTHHISIHEHGFVQNQVFNTTDVVNTKPFLLTDWQNPILPVHQVVPISYRPTIDPATPQPEIGIPFTQTDWQNPRINLEYRQFLNSGRVLGEEPFPFSQTEWLNPLLKPLARQGLVVAQIFNTADVVFVKPFLQSDWPNPVLPIPLPHSGFEHPLPYEVFIIVPPPVTTTRNRVFGMGRGYSNT